MTVVVPVVLAIILAALISSVVAVSPWRPRRRSSAKLTAAAGLEELHGLLSLGKRYELEQRRIVYSLRVENDTGAPPNDIDIDLNNGTARFNTRSRA